MQHLLYLLFRGRTALGPQAGMGVGQAHACIGGGTHGMRGLVVGHIGVDVGLGLYHAAGARNTLRAIDATAGAGVHLDEDMVQALDVLQHVGQTVDAVHGHIGITLRQRVEGADDAPRHRESFGQVHPAAVAGNGQAVDGSEVDIVLLEEREQLVEGQHPVDAVLVGLALLGQAGAHEDHLQLRVVLAQHLGMRRHGRIHRRQVGQRLGVVHLDQAAGSRTGGGDEVAHLALGEHTLVFLHHGLGTEGGLLDHREAQLGHRYAHHLEVVDPQAAHKRRRHRGGHMALTQQGAHLVQPAHGHLGLLRAGQRAVAAEDAVVLDHTGMMSFDFDRLHGTLAKATVAVLALDNAGFDIVSHSSCQKSVLGLVLFSLIEFQRGVHLRGKQLFDILGVHAVQDESALRLLHLGPAGGRLHTVAVHGDALGAMAQAETRLKIHKVFYVILFQYTLHFFYHGIAPFQMAGAADTYFNSSHLCLCFISRFVTCQKT